MSGNQMILLGGSQAPAVDPFFYSVTSLLHGDGTNGGQNNTFLDSSSNNFTITRNGNTTQGSFSPFSQTGWSNYFSTNSISLTDSSNLLDLGGAAASVELFVYPTAAGVQVIFSKHGGSSSWSTSNGFEYQIQFVNNIFNFIYNSSGSPATITDNVARSANAWYYIVVATDASNNISFYINGIRVATGTSAITKPSSRSAVLLGNDLNNNYTVAYVSNLRFVSGSNAINPTSTTITVPTSALTAVTGTRLLISQSNRFIDNSTNNFALTVTGTPSIQPFSPFNPITPYSTSSVGGSGYFDGSGDYLTVANSSNYALGTDNFTIELWVYPTATFGSGLTLFSHGYVSYCPWLMYTGSSGALVGYASSTGSSWDILSGTSFGTLVTGAWNHIALCRSGSTFYLCMNGVVTSTATSSAALMSIASGLTIGATTSGIGVIGSSYITNARIIKGTALYTSSYTPPTAPLTAVSGTQFLLSATNGAIFDNAAVADYETVGNAQISTSVKKYGTGSMAFDGTGDYLLTRDSPNLTLGAGDFTVEAWVYPTASPSQPIIVGQWDGVGGGTGLSWVLLLSNDSNRYLRFALSTNGSGVLTDSVSSTALALNAWNHVALVRCGSVFIAYLNGTSVVRYTISAGTALYDATNQVSVGSSSTGTQNFNGYIDDLRISNGVARYPYNFTPPTAEFPNIGGTVTLTADPYFDYTTLLLPGNGTNGAQNNTFLDSSSNAFSITRNGNTTQGTFSPFSQTGWGNYFDGTGDYLSVADNAALDLGTGDFTIEGWVYIADGIADNAGIVSKRNASAFNAGDYRVSYRTGTSKITFADDTVNERATPVVQKNSWVHFAIVRESGTISAYANGVRGDTAADTVNLGNADVQTIGVNATIFFTGYISNVRIVKGTAVYSGATYTIPTAPLTAVTNTSLLTCQANRFLDASSNNFTITRNGDVSVQAFSPFNPTAAWSAATNGGSGYFDGSGDYLTAASNAAFGLGTGDFTIETWLYPTANPANGPGTFLDLRTGATNSACTARVDSSLNLLFFDGPPGTSINTGTVRLNTWTHVAFVRSSGSLKTYINGTLTNTTAVSSDFGSNQPCMIGNNQTAGYEWNGYISNFRLVKGTAVYTSNFTPPTAPLTTITNTSLLLNFTNAGIYDATSKNDLETVGNAQISTTQSKFGGSSMYFDGTGDYLTKSIADPQTIFGTGDFTFECWVYPTTLNSYNMILGYASPNQYWSIRNTGYLHFYDGTTAYEATANAVLTNQWTHIAISRYGSTLRQFVNGVQALSSTCATSIGGASSLWFGASAAYPSQHFFTGYIDDLRITKGIARYTSNFTPPTTAFLTL